MADETLSSAYERVKNQLAKTLRHERTLRGVSRLELATDAQLSERYLAQLETARANPSLTVLLRLAQALDISLLQLLDLASLTSPAEASELIGQLTDRLNHSRRGIALVGLRGAGKSTLGRLLAEHLHWRFIRLTEVITDRTQIPLDELFSLGGEAAFRRLELESLQEVIRTIEDPLIIEIGGGLVTNKPAYELLRHHFTTIWLSTSPEEHMQRVIAQGDLRPMHGYSRAMDELRTILNERTPFYEEAELHVSTSRQTVEASLAQLDRLIREHLGDNYARSLEQTADPIID